MEYNSGCLLTIPQVIQKNNQIPIIFDAKLNAEITKDFIFFNKS